jgi:hypothetical protein
VKNLLVAVLVISVTSIALSQNAKPPAPALGPPALPALADPFAPPDGVVPIKTQRWEYKVSDRGGFEPGDWQKKLNDLATEGWELDAIDEGHYILRRPVQHPLRVFGAPD